MSQGFHDKNGVLHVDDIAVPEIVKQCDTPVYVYSANVIRQQYNALKEAMEKALPADRQPLLCYACKANSNIAILKLLQGLGSGLEIVSHGELFRGLKAGFKGEQIITTSFGKNETEIKACLDANILQFNIEAADELDNIARFALEKNMTANVVFRLNPNIAGGGNTKISTGRKEDKFGNTPEDIIALYDKAAKMDGLNPVGISMHIGSQVMQADTFEPGFKKIAEVVTALRDKGHTVTRTDIGGGFPIQYNNENLLDLDEYAAWVRDIILPLDTDIQLEPGRYMVGNAGILLCTAEYIKKTPSKNFLVLNAGMSELLRPALYGAYHDIRPILGHNANRTTYDVVGPICESSDIFGKDRDIPSVESGDLIAIMSAGAYGFAMASNNNSRPLPAEILVDGNKIAVISKPQTVEDLIARESIPDWL
ncbi:MAG: diaminopimelate decarboxylase [Alphaproteobacteria bacterium]|nr:diaminopimelate decarboxylase [Alphaproteobacteria bacterium]